jgi:hypothetical protein
MGLKKFTTTNTGWAESGHRKIWKLKLYQSEECEAKESTGPTQNEFYSNHQYYQCFKDYYLELVVVVPVFSRLSTGVLPEAIYHT